MSVQFAWGIQFDHIPNVSHILASVIEIWRVEKHGNYVNKMYIYIWLIIITAYQHNASIRINCWSFYMKKNMRYCAAKCWWEPTNVRMRTIDKCVKWFTWLLQHDDCNQLFRFSFNYACFNVKTHVKKKQVTINKILLYTICDCLPSSWIY